jgi:AcrR family transcriptional regulator
MAVQRLTPQRRRQLTHEALVHAAAQVFARRGYEGGTLDEIAERAGFTTGAVYSNFGSKEELFLAVLEDRNQRLTEQYRKLLEQPREQPFGLSDIAEVWTHHELADRDSLLLTLEFRLAALRDPQLGAKLATFERRTEETIAQFISERLRAIAGSHDPSVPIEDFAAVVYAANQGIWQHVAVCSADHSKLFETFLALLTHGLTPPSDDPGEPQLDRA